MVGRLLVLALAALVLLQAQPGVDAARILVVIAMPAPSHLIVFTGLTRVLAERGHHITLCAAFEKGYKLIPTKNHEFVSIQNAEIDKFKNDAVTKVMKGEQFNLRSMLNFVRLGPKMMRATLENSDFQALINKPGQKFDLIVTEVFFMHEALLPLGHKFDAPVIALNPFGISSQLADVMGNPYNPSWVPNPFLGSSDRMSFTERAINTLMTSFFYLSHRFLSLPAQQAIATEFFPDAPPLEELSTSRLSLCLINNHFSMSYPVPMSPGIVEVGGMHIPDKPKPLPKDLQDFLDGGKEGVIYFSMGSNLRMDLLAEKKVHAIFNALGAVKERVLMKWDGPIPKGIASNIRAVNWAPQSDILAHPNIRLFVTHGGLLSTQETVYHGVPTVGIPVMADQAFNLKFAVSKGYAVQLDFATLTEEALSAAIKESLQNPKYKQAVSKLSQLFRAKPMRPADTAVFWVEHVLQHGGDHLRPAVVHLPLYQSLLLDILAALALAIALLFLVLRTAYRALCWCFCSRKRDPVKTARGKKTN